MKKMYVRCQVLNLKTGGERTLLLVVPKGGATMHDEIKKSLNQNEVLVEAIVDNN